MSTRLAELRPLSPSHPPRRGTAGTRLRRQPHARSRTGDAGSTIESSRSEDDAGDSTQACASRGQSPGCACAAEDRPSATSADIAAVSGVQGGTLGALLARLVNSGELQRGRCRPAEPDTHSVTRSRKRPQTFHPPPTTPRRSRTTCPIAGRRAWNGSRRTLPTSRRVSAASCCCLPDAYRAFKPPLAGRRPLAGRSRGRCAVGSGIL